MTLASEATAVCTITTNAFTSTVYAKPTLGARLLAARTSEPGCAGTRACYMITHSTVLARAILGAVPPVGSLGTHTLTEDTCVSVHTGTCAIYLVT